MNNKKLIISGVSALSFFAAAQANAQQAEVQAASEKDGKSSGLEEIVVTATRSETNLQTTPIAVSALSSESLRERSIGNLADVAAYVPSLSIGAGQGLGSGTPNIAIRGIGVNSGDQDSSVGTYVDEVYFSSGRGNILGLMDTARVEVLRGPQGTLFGRNTIAGAIQYVTNAPQDEFGGYITGNLGSFERREIEGAINLPVSSTLALRVAGRYADRDGYVFDETARINRGSETTKAVRARALWTPTDALTVNLKLEHVEFENNGRAALVPVGGVNTNTFFAGTAAFLGGFTANLVRARAAGAAAGSFWESNNFRPGDYSTDGFNSPDYFRYRQTIAQGTVEYHLSDDVKLKSITSMSWFRHQLAVDIDQTPLNILSIIDPNFRTKAFTEELQLTGSLFDYKLSYTAGVYYFNRTSRQVPSRILTSPLFGGPISIDGDPANKNEAIAGFVQLGYSLTPSLTLNAGVRYSYETVTGRLLAIPGNRTTRSFSDVSPQFGLDFEVSDDLFLYVKAAKGFRAGGFTLNPAAPGGSLFFGQETAWTYEAGMRLTALDGRLRFNPTVYQTDWKNIQFLDNGVFNGTLIAFTRNAGDARIRGFELESQFAVTDELQLRGSFGYIDGNYQRIDAGLLGLVPLNAPLARAPETKYSIGAVYTFPLDIPGKITVNADYNWVADQQSAVRTLNTVLMPSVGLLSARLQYSSDDSRFSVAVFGTNLTNKYYLIGGTRFGTEGTVFGDTNDVGRPREVGVEVRFSF